jgi:hypothetical protein
MGMPIDLSAIANLHRSDRDRWIRETFDPSWCERLLNTATRWVLRRYPGTACFKNDCDEYHVFSVVRPKMYRELTDMERLRPQCIDSARRKDIAAKLAIHRLYVDYTLCLLKSIRVNHQMTLSDAVEFGRRVFSTDVIRVLKETESIPRLFGEEFVDSAHWLLSLHDFGPESVCADMRRLGLDRESMVAARIRLEGRMVPPGGRTTNVLWLSDDGADTFRCLVNMHGPSTEPLMDAREFAAGIVREGRSKAAAILGDLSVDIPLFVSTMATVPRR